MVVLPLSLVSFSGPACIWDRESTTTKDINGNQLTIERHDCVNKGNRYVYDVYTAFVVDTKGKVVTLQDGGNYKAIRLLPNLPINALYFLYPGASNVGNSIRIYDKNWKQTKVLNNPVNEFHVTNRNGSELKIIGFFKIDGDWFIENIRSLGGQCNACMEYVIDTYKVTGDDLVVIDSRDPNWGNYQRYVAVK